LQAVAASAGIGEFYGNLFPQDKAAKIAAQENLGHRVAMAGDSFNDILALLQADISLAFCNAQNAFASWVDIRLGGKDFGAVKTAFELDSRQKNIERQNILISIIFSFAAIYAVLVLKQSAAWYHIAALVFGAVFIIIINCTRLYKI